MSERWMRIGRMLKLRYRYYLLFQSKLHIAKRRVRHPLKLGESKKKKKKRNIRKRVPTDPRRKDYRIEANRPKDSFNEERKKKKKIMLFVSFSRLPYHACSMSSNSASSAILFSSNIENGTMKKQG